MALPFDARPPGTEGPPVEEDLVIGGNPDAPTPPRVKMIKPNAAMKKDMIRAGGNRRMAESAGMALFLFAQSKRIRPHLKRGKK